MQRLNLCKDRIEDASVFTDVDGCGKHGVENTGTHLPLRRLGDAEIIAVPRNIMNDIPCSLVKFPVGNEARRSWVDAR